MCSQGVAQATKVDRMNNEEATFLAAISKQIRVELEEHEMDQKDLAEAVNIGRPTLNRYMQGHQVMPMPVFYRVAAALKLSPDELMARAWKRVPQGE